VSDLVLSENRPARVRIGDQYHEVAWAVFDSSSIMAILQPVMTADRHALFHQQGNLDTAFEIKDRRGVLRRFRVNLFRHIDGIASAWRPIWDTVPSLEELRLPSQLMKLSQFPYGLVLITGPTGSGKSTTLSAIIEHINQTYRRHIITLEDPIEYRFRDALSVIHQREVGLHVDSFSTGLKSALREAPDVILVGEMRDKDTISAALTAAETGHLVLSTLHSGHSAQAIDRVIDVFPEHQQQQVRTQLADVLRAVVTQRLLPAANGGQRIPAVELVLATYAVSNTIREGRTHQLTSLIQSGSQNGMIPFDLSLAKLVSQGLIESRVAEQYARDTSFFESLVKRNLNY
jgi:twitching motility protein PilT